MEEFQLIAQKANFQATLYQEDTNKKTSEKSNLTQLKR